MRQRDGRMVNSNVSQLEGLNPEWLAAAFHRCSGFLLQCSNFICEYDHEWLYVILCASICRMTRG